MVDYIGEDLFVDLWWSATSPLYIGDFT